MMMLTSVARQRGLVALTRASQARTAYTSVVIEHYENPKNVGSLDKNKTSVGTGLVGAPACGTFMLIEACAS